MWIRKALIAALFALFAAEASAGSLTPAQQSAIDESVGEWLARTGAPSVSIAVVSGGDLVYAKAYGEARLAPRRPATTATRYHIDSLSKEFTAAAVLRLQEQGLLSLDDHVAKFFPALAGADKTTIRQLLSHTAGYRDYWPQDFIPLEMQRPVTTRALLDEWATKPLDFEPGAQWQYSNTGYVIAGAIVEKVSGQELFDFLRANVFSPLHMEGVWDADQKPLPADDAGAYTRFGNGPIRPAPKEGAGWLFAASDLATTPSALAMWDIALINRSLLAPSSYQTLYTPVKLTDGTSSHYSAGLSVTDDHGRLRLSHGGGGSGFLSRNTIWPDEKAAVIAFTNNDWVGPEDVVARVAFVTVPPSPAEARARKVFEDFQSGRVDRSLFTENGSAYLAPAVLADQQRGLAPFGAARIFELQSETQRGGMLNRQWKITTAHGVLSATERAYPGGKIEQFIISKAD